ncbi:hypothetical protein [Fervidibacillus halotolerans]|uniref:Uncharacterized protein n=1 Tax=Fervidibacillus halotolerans TaxID=2980027 RepID=A0A9E8M029_9BACI|nr:hypothetical protein [Fervidibacillus halotolerans]WAA12146.1 hypothetical protein OE105_11295 [Fervidibacillus halotolerans]
MEKIDEQAVKRDELLRMLIKIVGKTNEKMANLEVKVKKLEKEWMRRQTN